MDARDAQVLEGLRRAGSKLDQPHSLLHYVYVPAKEKAETVGRQLKKDGLTVEVRQAAMGTDWLVLARHQVVPTDSQIAKLRALFEAVAKEAGGEYDGWEAGVRK